ncbi:unnamed protein product [Linum tenue]|uniref:Uncharacterized protein n=1 Tax=Linum tenue TaxID=586396 RepID=A0AAV0RW43_9ROSI|nr:unnamed protein product [Linum tenue]CAI0597586.1 unnamed protein product [Linum tenue]
MEKGDSLFQLS